MHSETGSRDRLLLQAAVIRTHDTESATMAVGITRIPLLDPWSLESMEMLGETKKIN